MCPSETYKFCILKIIISSIIVGSLGGILVAIILQKAEYDRCHRPIYQTSTEKVTWEEAKALCRSTFGESYSLATVESDSMWDRLFHSLENMTETPFWIAAVYDESKNDYYWDGKNKIVDRVAIRALWGPGHPGKKKNNTRLVILRQKDETPITLPHLNGNSASQNLSAKKPSSTNPNKSSYSTNHDHRDPSQSPVLQVHHKDTKQRYLCRMSPKDICK